MFPTESRRTAVDGGAPALHAVRWRRGTSAAVLLTAGMMVASGLAALPASAAVPAFPDNIVVFPDRDFLGLEGYAGQAGKTALIEVQRDGAVVGSTSGPIINGDPALEVNHPGGVCWGNETSLQVTPDIKPGDTVVLKVEGQVLGDTTVADAYVDQGAALNGSTVTVTGKIAAGVNRDQVEQRIVNPDLKDLIGRRDVRALPGSVVASPNGGYSSGLEFTGDRFLATYVFDSPAAAQLAATGGGERMMSWLEQDADGNRQGLTIAEYGELGGPGMGGCPAGPADQQSPAPGTATVTRSGTEAVVKWTPTAAVPGAAALVGYSVEAIAATTTGDEQLTTGKRINSALATGTRLAGLDAAAEYRFEVRSIDAAGTSGKPTVATVVTATPPPTGPNENPAPTVTASPVAGQFTDPFTATLTSPDGGEIYYTTDGSGATTGDMPSDGAQLYSGPIAIGGTTDVDLAWVVFDAAGNYRTGSAIYTYLAPDAPPAVPSAPTDLAVQTDVQALTATVTWSAPTTNATVVSGYEVLVNDAAITRADATATTEQLTGLAYDTPYVIKVVALGPDGNSPAAASAPVTLVSPDAGLPSAPQNVQAVAGHQSARVTWAASASSPNSTITRYDVQALSGTTPVGAVVPVAASAVLTTTVGGLTNGEPYTVRVTAVNTADKTSSTVSNEVVPTDVIAVTAAEFRTGRNEWRVSGTSRAPGSTVVVTATIGTRTVTLGQVPVQPDGTWAFRERNAPVARRASAGTTVTVTSNTGATPVTTSVTIRS